MAAISVSADGHFNIPEGTTTIVSRLSWQKEGEDSWEIWGVDKRAVKSVTIPDSVTTIGEFAFNGCTSLASITIPDSVTTIGVRAFLRCTSLASIAIPDSVTAIGRWAFLNCTSLASITIPDSVTTIGDETFAGCSSLPPVHFDVPDGTVSIEKDWWAAWKVLKVTICSITIPGSVTTIGGDAFNGCISLASITIPGSVTTIGEFAFNGCISLTSIAIPDSATTIGMYAFYGCSSLASITIPESVTAIRACAFGGCDLLTMALVKPAATPNGGVVAANLWNKVFEVPEEGDAFFDEIADLSGHAQVAPFQHVNRIWAPDAIVNELTGPLAEYSTFASIPRAMRAAPDATTWAAVELWLWWSPPTEAGYTNRAGVCKDARIVCKTRRITLFAATMVGMKAAKATSLPPLPPPIWLLIFGFLKHDETPAYAVV